MATQRRNLKQHTDKPSASGGAGRYLAIFAVLIIAAAAGYAFIGGSPKPSTDNLPQITSGPNNVVLITIDTLRADHLGCYGYARDTSPNIDQLAVGGIRFDQAEVQWPKTWPSLASILTSTYAEVNGVGPRRAKLNDRLTTLGEAMKEGGLYTGAFVSNVNVGKHYKYDAGFDEFYEMWDTSEGLRTQNQGTDFFSNKKIADMVIDWLNKHHDKRFFLWVHFLDPHGPYQPPTDLAQRYFGDEIHTSQNRLVPPERLPNYQKVTKHLKTVGDFVAEYDAEIRDVDRNVGRIIETIDKLGRRKNTLLAVSSDHGESLGEHGYYFNHGKYVYEACTRVPLIFNWPGEIPAGQVVDPPVALIHLLPTLLDVSDVTSEAGQKQFLGSSVARVLYGEPLGEMTIFMQSESSQYAVREGDWKYITDPRKSTKAVPVVGKHQIYNLESDPLEADNRIKEQAELANALLAKLRRWSADLKMIGDIFKSQKADDRDAPPDVLNRIRSLGYVVGDEADKQDHVDVAIPKSVDE